MSDLITNEIELAGYYEMGSRTKEQAYSRLLEV